MYKRQVCTLLTLSFSALFADVSVQNTGTVSYTHLRFEEHHKVKYSVAALTTAAELSARFINDRRLPDKAIDVIDEAGAAQRILPKSKQKKTIGKAEIEEIIARIARVPAQSVNQEMCIRDRYYVTVAALDALARVGEIPAETVARAIEKYGMDSEKPNPIIM